MSQIQNIEHILGGMKKEDALRALIPHVLHEEKVKKYNQKKIIIKQQKEKKEKRKQKNKERRTKLDEILSYITFRMQNIRKRLEVSLVEIALFCHVVSHIGVNLMRRAAAELGAMLEGFTCSYNCYEHKIIIAEWKG
jgi:hypothetical protein